jgi:biopolymer transport protein ExbB/TolQ
VSIAHSIQSIGFLTDFSESVLAYPIVLSTHLTCIALFAAILSLVLWTAMFTMGRLIAYWED